MFTSYLMLYFVLIIYTRFTLVDPKKIKACKSFAFNQNFLLVENKEHLFDFCSHFLFLITLLQCYTQCEVHKVNFCKYQFKIWISYLWIKLLHWKIPGIFGFFNATAYLYVFKQHPNTRIICIRDFYYSRDQMAKRQRIGQTFWMLVQYSDNCKLAIRTGEIA